METQTIVVTNAEKLRQLADRNHLSFINRGPYGVLTYSFEDAKWLTMPMPLDYTLPPEAHQILKSIRDEGITIEQLIIQEEKEEKKDPPKAPQQAAVPASANDTQRVSAGVENGVRIVMGALALGAMLFTALLLHHDPKLIALVDGEWWEVYSWDH